MTCRDPVRLAALVPRPRLHLTRFHGVLATNAKLRSQAVPKVDSATLRAGSAQYANTHALGQLRKRVFDIDIEQCVCGGKLKRMAVIEQRDAIKRYSPIWGCVRSRYRSH